MLHRHYPSGMNSLAGLGFDTDSGHAITCCEFFNQHRQVLSHKLFADRLCWADLVTDGQQLGLYNLDEKRMKKHKVTMVLLPFLNAFYLPYFTSLVAFFPRTFFTLLKANLHAPHTPGIWRQSDTNRKNQNRIYTNFHLPLTGRGSWNPVCLQVTFRLI